MVRRSERLQNNQRYKDLTDSSSSSDSEISIDLTESEYSLSSLESQEISEFSNSLFAISLHSSNSVASIRSNNSNLSDTHLNESISVESNRSIDRNSNRFQNNSTTVSSISRNQNNKMSLITNPFANPLDLTKPEGMKMFTKACAGLTEKEKYDGQEENGKYFKNHCKAACNKYQWGPVITSVLAQSDGKEHNILLEFNKFTREDLILNAQKTWSEGATDFKVNDSSPSADTMQKRIRSAIIATWLLDSLTEAAKLDLEVHKDDYEFTKTDGTIERDGPVMLFILQEEIEPASRLGAETLLEDLKSLSLDDYDHNLKKFLVEYQRLLCELKVRDEPYEKPVPLLLSKLVKHKNSEFSLAMQKKQDKYDEGKTYTLKKIVTDSVSKMTNIKARERLGRRGQRDKDVVKDSSKKEEENQVMALLTELNSRVSNIEKGPSTSNNQTDSLDRSKVSNVERWRMKQTGSTKVVDGITWYWCPKHTLPGVFDGLYVRHKPEDHDEWKNRKSNRNKSSNNNSNNSSSSGSSDTNNPRLSLKPSLKQALMTDHGLSEVQVDLLLQEHKGN